MKLRQARAMLPTLEFDDAVHARVSELCIEAHVDGLRADLVMLRAARALAAFEEASAVNVEHVERVAESVLLHRRKEGSAPSEQGAAEPRNKRKTLTKPASATCRPSPSTSQQSRTSGRLPQKNPEPSKAGSTGRTRPPSMARCFSTR